MLRYRIIFGLLFSALLVGLFYLDSHLADSWPKAPWLAPPGTILVLALLTLIPLALREMQGLLRRQNVHISMRVCVAAALLSMAWPWISQVANEVKQFPTTQQQTAPAWATVAKHFDTVKPHYLVPTIMAASLLGAFIMHTRHHRIEGAITNAGGTLLAIVYLGVLPGFFLPICLTHGSWMVLGIVAIVKLADVGAYLTGRLIGRHKLIPWLSPGKTIEGFIGGLAFAGAAGVVLWHLKVPPHPADSNAVVTALRWVVPGALLGMVLGAVGQLGDLMESLLKRDAGVKDSGKVPGFGGVLDLLDSPLLAAPVAYWMLKLLGHVT